MSYNKKNVFKHELLRLKNEKIREYFEKAVELLPDYFFEIPASSTGKYHPEYATGHGGLVRHTKAFFHILADLLDLEFIPFGDDEKDIMLGAALVHDGCKSGMPKQAYSAADHPLIAAEYLKNAEGLKGILSEEQEQFCYNVIAAHMGQWNTDYKSKKEILPKPATWQEFMVHVADYLASRKYLDFKFDEWYDPKNYVSTELADKIKEIIDYCKTLITSGLERDSIYQVIEATAGNKNPNAIKDVETANKVYENLVRLSKGEEVA